ncbi:MAG: Endonuclease MutS2 [Gemmatimonadaceae bacterium]|nr:Endonuclease MutS2 [Gemmatimonadaceae bacterium]
MNRHALAVLEFDRALEFVAGYASSAPGARAVRERSPRADRDEVERELAMVFALVAMLRGEVGWGLPAIPDCQQALVRLRIEGTTLTGMEVLQIWTLLRGSRLVHEALGDARHPAMSLALLADLRIRLFVDRRLEEAIERVVDDDGLVRDDASPALRRIRRELRSSEGDLVSLLERIMGRLESQHRVLDMSITMRNGRYVIPVRREAARSVGGIVHDVSHTGATVFVEPPAAIAECNRIRELEGEEAREVDRIMLELADRLRPEAEAMHGSMDALVTLDDLHARARYAIAFECQPVALCLPLDGFDVRRGRHPLLLAQGVAVVPFDLQLLPLERTLLISGPNTGGKTVLLKTLGLFAAMLQSGIPVPVARQSRLAVFDDLFADIGDEQSIEASLSTFSAHVKNLGEVLDAATEHSLVLIDELGSGTDPLEGAAIGGAIIEALTTRGATTIATTHLGALKELASEMPAVVNASLQFDERVLAPTYNLTKGIPGRSYGISIARRLRLPEEVLARAEARIPQVERDVAALLRTLQARENELAVQLLHAERTSAENEARAASLQQREREVRDRERAVEREARREARGFLLQARAEVERTIRDLRSRAESDVDEAARVARQSIEQMAAEQGAHLAALEEVRPEETPLRPIRGDLPKIGDRVEVLSMEGREGRLVERRGDTCVVAIGTVKMSFPITGVRRSGRDRRAPEAIVPMRGDLPDDAVPTEIDLRGLRVGDLDDIVLTALDAAIRADLRSLRIIHGKGTGALRDRVAEMLRKDTRVKSFRLGAWNEGGAGVTVADL